MEQPLLGGPPAGRWGALRAGGWGVCGPWSPVLRAWLPVLVWLPRYTAAALRRDLVAGVTVGLTTVPQALAYAEVAGLPVEYGLYSAFMGGFVYPLLGTSKDLSLGPTAIMSLLCASVVGGRAGRAVLLSLLCGAVQTALGLLRLGFLLDFVSYPVIKGFTCAAAVTIGVGQIKTLLGLRGVPQAFYLEVYYTFSRLPEARPGDALLGLLCLALLLTLQRMKSSLGTRTHQGPRKHEGPWTDQGPQTDEGHQNHEGPRTHEGPQNHEGPWTHEGPRIHEGPLNHEGPQTDQGPRNLEGPRTAGGPWWSRAARRFVCGAATVRNAVVVLAASALAAACLTSGFPVFTVTGETAQGLPAFRPPPTSETTANGTVVSFLEILEGFGGGLAVIPLMGVLESIAIAKAFASQNDYRVDNNQELLAIGLTNIMGSFVSAYPVTGSFGRTAVNSQSGACTPAAGIVNSVMVLLSLAVLMPAFRYIPKASLAAVIICAVAPMVDYGVVEELWRVRKRDLLPFSVTFLLSFWEVQYGILGGVAVSGAMLLHQAARPPLKVTDHGVLLVELGGGLSFPASEHLSHVLHNHALQASPPRSVVLDLLHVSAVDSTVVSQLRGLLRLFRRRGAGLVLTRVQPSVLEVLLAADLPGLRHTEDLSAALQGRLDDLSSTGAQGC